VKPRGRRLAVWIEWCFGAAILVAIFGLVRDVLVYGYLPDPFLHAKSDTFMDWYNPAYWANNRGTYSIWRSIYPPFSFVFVRLFSRAVCYDSIESVRECDPTGIVVITALTVVNFVLALLIFRKVDRDTALPRAIAVGLGFPVIFAWERGNLNVPCFTAYLLGFGNLVKSARLRTLCTAISLNFKPYLILALMGRFVKREWARLEWCALWFVAIYAASFAMFGSGDPITIARNTMGFEHTPGVDLISFTTTYTAILTILKLPLPFIEFIGSSPIEAIESIIPVLIYAGVVGALICLFYAMLRPNICTREQASAIILILFMSISTAPGGYAIQFALFFLFLEKWSGLSWILIIVSSYLWCLPFDYPIANIYDDYGFSFLGQRMVFYPLPLTFGELSRPGLLLLIEYGLVGVFVGNIIRDLRSLRGERAASAA
jgi:hypothetical protein